MVNKYQDLAIRVIKIKRALDTKPDIEVQTILESELEYLLNIEFPVDRGDTSSFIATCKFSDIYEQVKETLPKDLDLNKFTYAKIL